MKNKKEQIEEMAKVIRTWKNTNDINYRFGTHYSNILYNAGYRKASDVIDEFVERLLLEVNPFCFSLIGREIKAIIITLSAEMRQEVEK